MDSIRKKIGWIKIYSKKYGGVVYGEQARKALSSVFDLELVDFEARIFKSFRYFKIPESFAYLLRLKGEKDLWIRDFYSALTMPLDRTKGKNIVLIFHIDFSGFPLLSRPFFLIAEKLLFYRALKRADAIVVVSEYWKKHFEDREYKNVFKAYCGFDLEKFDVSEEEVKDFKEKHNLLGKPIIYLGNCQRPKGVIESREALEGLDAHFVTSGREEVKIKALNLNLDYRGYLTLLKASSVALTMSKFKEGWCMTAQEAMLCKTPVVGSGLGGMKELLEGGKQIVCPGFKDLKEKVAFLLSHEEERKRMGEQGYAFAREFSRQRFNEDWIKIINNVVK